MKRLRVVCALVGVAPESNSMVLEHTAPARDQDTWQALLEPALAGLNCKVMQATSDEAPGLLASVAHHLGAHHSPDLFHVQHELNKAVSAPMATKQRAAAKALAKAEETLKRVHEPRHHATEEPQQRGPGPPQGGSKLGAGGAGRGHGSSRAPTARRAAVLRWPANAAG